MQSKHNFKSVLNHTYNINIISLCSIQAIHTIIQIVYNKLQLIYKDIKLYLNGKLSVFYQNSIDIHNVVDNIVIYNSTYDEYLQNYTVKDESNLYKLKLLPMRKYSNKLFDKFEYSTFTREEFLYVIDNIINTLKYKVFALYKYNEIELYLNNNEVHIDDINCIKYNDEIYKYYESYDAYLKDGSIYSNCYIKRVI